MHSIMSSRPMTYFVKFQDSSDSLTCELLGMSWIVYLWRSLSRDWTATGRQYRWCWKENKINDVVGSKAVTVCLHVIFVVCMCNMWHVVFSRRSEKKNVSACCVLPWDCEFSETLKNNRYSWRIRKFSTSWFCSFFHPFVRSWSLAISHVCDCHEDFKAK